MTELLAWAGVLALIADASSRLRATVLGRAVPAPLPLTDGSLPAIPPLEPGEAGSGAGRARLELVLGGASPAPYEPDGPADNYGAW